MDKNPTETAQADVTETVTTETEAQAEESSSSQETDYEALIEAERKPDPDKAKEAFKKRQEKRQEETHEPEEEDESDEDKPMTRREMEQYLARRTQEIVATANVERIQEIATGIADNEGEARFIMEIHKNRVFPEGMSLRDQLEEAKAIATVKRVNAKNAELARKVNSKETASKDTSSGVQVETKSEPGVSADVKASLRNAGFTYDQSMKLYTKTLPNGKKMYRDPKTNRSGLL